MDPELLEEQARQRQGALHKLTRLFGSPGQAQSLEEAANLWAQSGHARRARGSHALAAQNYLCAASIYRDLGLAQEALRYKLEAVKVLKHNDPKQAAHVLQGVVDGLAASGAWRRAASHAHEAAELYFRVGEHKKACAFFLRAAEWYIQDSPVLACKSYHALADAYAGCGEYSAAVQHYEDAAALIGKHSLSQHTLDRVHLKSVLCRLCGGLAPGRGASGLIQNIAAAKDLHEFDVAVAALSRRQTLEEVAVQLCSRARTVFEQAELV